MIVTVLCVLVIYQPSYIVGQVAGISSKLDFGGSQSTTVNYDSTLSTNLVKALVSLKQSTGPSRTIVSSKLDQSPFNLRSIAPLAQKPDGRHDFASLGVVCVDGSCNATNQNASNLGDKLSTDILVQVVTNLHEKENKSASTPISDDDVPVVIGYKGTNIPDSVLQSASRKIDGIQDVIIQTNPTVDKHYNYNYYHVSKDNEIKPKDNDFQHQIPYFEPSFNNHYFGENPPPQFVWHRTRIGHNPHAFNPNTRPYKPVGQWFLKYPVTGRPHNTADWSPTTTCTCTNPGLNWYPSFGPHLPTPSAPVNDKLGPLN